MLLKMGGLIVCYMEAQGTLLAQGKASCSPILAPHGSGPAFRRGHAGRRSCECNCWQGPTVLSSLGSMSDRSLSQWCSSQTLSATSSRGLQEAALSGIDPNGHAL